MPPPIGTVRRNAGAGANVNAGSDLGTAAAHQAWCSTRLRPPSFAR